MRVENSIRSVNSWSRIRAWWWRRAGSWRCSTVQYSTMQLFQHLNVSDQQWEKLCTLNACLTENLFTWHWKVFKSVKALAMQHMIHVYTGGCFLFSSSCQRFIAHDRHLYLVLCASICYSVWRCYEWRSAIEKVNRTKEQEALETAELLKEAPDEVSKLEPIVEEDHQSIEKSSLLVGKSGEVQVPKRRVTIVDGYTNGAGDLSTTVGKWFYFFLLLRVKT